MAASASIPVLPELKIAPAAAAETGCAELQSGQQSKLSALMHQSEPGSSCRLIGMCCSWDDTTDAGHITAVLCCIDDLDHEGVDATCLIVLDLSGVHVCDTRLVAALVRACALAGKRRARIVAVVSGTVADWLSVCGVGRIVPHLIAA